MTIKITFHYNKFNFSLHNIINSLFIVGRKKQLKINKKSVTMQYDFINEELSIEQKDFLKKHPAVIKYKIIKTKKIFLLT